MYHQWTITFSSMYHKLKLQSTSKSNQRFDNWPEILLKLHQYLKSMKCTLDTRIAEAVQVAQNVPTISLKKEKFYYLFIESAERNIQVYFSR